MKRLLIAAALVLVAVLAANPLLRQPWQEPRHELDQQLWHHHVLQLARVCHRPRLPAINGALADPKLKARLADVGGTVLAGSSADFAKLIADETEKWGKVVKFTGIKAD